MQSTAKRFGVADVLSHREDLRRLASRVVRSSHDAEDVVQDVLLQTLHRPPRDVRDLGRWLRVATLRTAVRHRDSVARRDRVEGDAAIAGEQPSFVHGLAERAALVELAREVERLDTPYADVLRLRYLEELGYPETARRLGISEENARARVKRALDRLRERLASRRTGFLSFALALLWYRAARGATDTRAQAGAARSLRRLLAAGAVVLVVLVAARLVGDEPQSTEAEAAQARGAAANLDGGARTAEPTTSPPAGRVAVATPGARAETATLGPATPRVVTVRGVARTASGPVAGTRIHLSPVQRDPGHEPPSGDATSVAAVAGPDGSFLLGPVRGDQWIWAEADGWTPSFRLRLDTLPVGANEDGALALELRFTDPVEDRLFEVRTPHGAPVAGAAVVLGGDAHPYWGGQGGQQLRRTLWTRRTDERGRVWLPVSTAQQPLTIRADGHAPWSGVVADAEVLGDGMVVGLSAGVRLSGVLRDGRGEPVSDGEVLVRPPRVAPLATRSDARGAFQLEHVPRGEFVLVAWDSADARRSVVQRGHTDDGVLDLSLEQGFAVHGQARLGEQPLVGWQVLLADPSGAPTRRWTTTDAAGAFAFGGVEPAGPGRAPEASVFLFAPERGDVPLAAASQVGPGRPLTLLARQPTARVVGHLSDPAAAGRVRLELRLPDPLASSIPVEVAPDGRWATPTLPPGSYTLHALRPGAGVARLGALTLAEDQTLVHAPVELPALAALRVRYEGRGARPALHGWSLELRDDRRHPINRHADRGFVGRDLVAHPDGFTVAGLLPGRYLFTLKAVTTNATAHEIELVAGRTTELAVPLDLGVGVRLVLTAPRAALPGETVDLWTVDADGTRRWIRERAPLGQGERAGADLLRIAWYLEVEDRLLGARTSGGLHAERLVLAEEIRRGAELLLELR